jgi:hypothetical protein
MKSTFNAFVISCMMSFTAVAGSPAIVTVTPAANGMVFNINYKTTEAGTVKVSIYNNANQLVFAETINNVASFIRPYNFSQMSEGEYTIVVVDKNSNQVEKVNYSLNKLTSFISVSQVANAENKYALNVSNNGTEVVYVKIYDNNETLIHEQSVEVTGSFGLIYNLSQVKSTTGSAVTFEISTSNGKTQTIKF